MKEKEKDSAHAVPASATSSTEPSVTSNNRTLVNLGSVVRGEFDIKGDLFVEGELAGRLKVTNRFSIGSKSRVTSEGVECAVADIAGTLEGPLTVSELLTIHAGGYVKGDITVMDIVIEKGGRFDGHCQYLAPTERNGRPSSGPDRDNREKEGKQKNDKGESA